MTLIEFINIHPIVFTLILIYCIIGILIGFSILEGIINGGIKNKFAFILISILFPIVPIVLIFAFVIFVIIYFVEWVTEQIS